MKYICLTFLLSFIICGCDKVSNEIEALLNGVESYIEEYPEDALKVLENIDEEELSSRKLRAKHSLLYSMALDKNYIDVVTDSIIAPAVKYYKYYGTSEEKFKALYYYGRVFQNSKETEAAMEKFVEAEHYISSHTDKRIVARLYKAKMVAYRDVFDYKSALEQAKTAALYYWEVNDTLRYLNAVNDIAVLCRQLDDKESESKYLRVLESNIHLMNESQLSNYYAILLNSLVDISDDSVNDVLSEYLSVISDKSIIQWLSVANVCILLEDYESALMSLDNYVLYGGLEDAAYYWTSATLYEEVGYYDKALIFYKSYQQTTDNKDISIFESDTKFIEERFDAELKSVRQTFYIVISTLSLAVIVLALIILSQRIKKVKEEKRIQKIKFDEVKAQCVLLKEEKNEIERMFVSLKSEIKQLKKIRTDKSIDKDILASVEQRLNVLNKFILAEFSDSFEKIAYTELGKLMENREEFMESTKKIFMISHPKFMAYLRKCNLTEWEIGCCCLYCIGFNGAEISEYLNRKAIYNVNSVIRQKLDIPKGKTQIDIFLKQKMLEFQS